MKYIFSQTVRDKNYCEFSLLDGDRSYGMMHIEEGAVMGLRRLRGSFFGRDFYMENGKLEGVSYPKESDPYRISYDNGKFGTVYQVEKKTGFMKSYIYRQILLAEGSFEAYPMMLGEEGTKVPVYRDGVQVALVEKDMTVIGDMHYYNVYAADETAALAAAFLCCYQYAFSAFKPHVTVNPGHIHKAFGKDTNKELLSMYDPDFINRI